MEQTDNIKIITRNRKARHEYHILQTYEAGIVLHGTEVKSLREGKANISDAYATIEEGEVWLNSLHINEYKQGTYNNHEPLRKRKLLLNRSEIKKLRAKVLERGHTLVPLSLYFKQGKVKVELALAQGKKTYDKRKAIAEKDFKRTQERRVKF